MLNDSNTQLLMRRSQSRIWLPTNNFYSSLNIRYAYALSAKLTDCWHHLVSTSRTRKCTKAIFSNRFSNFVKAKSMAIQPLRQARLSRSPFSPRVDLVKPSYDYVLHSSVRWTSSFLATQRSFKLLGPSLHPRHTLPVLTGEFKKLEEFKDGARQSLFTSSFNTTSSKRQLDTFSRLKMFSEYLKLQNLDCSSMPFIRTLVPKSRRPRITAYLFVGLRRPPALLFSSPLKSFWNSFRKFQKSSRTASTFRRGIPTISHSRKHFLGAKSSKSSPILNRTRSSLNRSWMLSLNFSRSPSLYTQSLKENIPFSDLTNQSKLVVLSQNRILPTLSSRWLRLSHWSGLRTSKPQLHSRIRGANHLTRNRLRRALRSTSRSYTAFWLRQVSSVRTRNPFLKRNLVFPNLQVKPVSSPQHPVNTCTLSPSYHRYLSSDSLSNALNTIRRSQYLLLPILEHAKSGNRLSAKLNLPNKSELILKPSYSPLFTLSPFGFLGYILTSTSKIMDILRSTVTYSPTVNYLVFPDANAVKTSIFRRLNRQKFLSSARASLYHQSTAVSTPSRFIINSSYWPKSSPGTPSRHTSITTGTSLSFTKDWGFRKFTESMTPAVNRTPRIRRIRFKPGYQRIWRIARTSARELLGFTSRYQYRLTPKLQQHYHQTRVADKVKLSLTVEFALLTSNFIPDHWSLKELLNSHNVFLNGISCTNPKLRLFCGDFLQLVVGLQYYAMSRWLTSWSTQKKGRVSKTFYRKFKPSTFNKNIKLVRRLPDWFYDLQYTYTDIPKYFEVDYFTLSIFLIHDNISQERWLPNRADQMDYSSTNMYNWKYIT